MSETTAEKTAEATEADKKTTEAKTTETTKVEKVAGEEALGDPGKKALDAMKAERKTAREEAVAEKARADALQAKIDGKEAEFTAQEEARKVESAALDKANKRIVSAEIKAAAKGVLADPKDAYKFLDLTKFEVDDDGNVDESAIASALAELVKEKPYLAAQGGKRFQGTADGGARNDASTPSQLTRADMARMNPEQIDAATREGRFADLMAGKQ